MKFCSHCGKELLDDVVICPSCGCWTKPKNEDAGLSKESKADNYSPLSIVGFVLPLIGVALLGLILSIVANNEAKRTGSAKSQSLSKAGIIISAVFLGISAVAVIAVVFIMILGLGLGSALIWF